MGYSNYLIDKDGRVMIRIGRISEEVFNEEFEIYEKGREFLMNEVADNENYWEILSTKWKDLNVGQYKNILKIFEMGLQLSSLESSRLALEYKYRNPEKKLAVVGEEVAEEDYYGYYTVIE